MPEEFRATGVLLPFSTYYYLTRVKHLLSLRYWTAFTLACIYFGPPSNFFVGRIFSAHCPSLVPAKIFVSLLLQC